MKLPIRIFSDLHLGHRASRINDVESLRPLFHGAGTVIFNGDTWEELSPHWKSRSAEMLAKLREILIEQCCDSIFLPGNHDPGWDGVGFIELAGGRIVVSHGDALLRDGAPWKREMLAGSGIIDELWEGCPAAHHDANVRHELARRIARRLPNLSHPEGRSVMARVIDAAFPPRRAIAMIRAWIGQARLGAEFCKRYFPQAEVLVTGHFHCLGVRKSRNCTVINTGSFVVPGPAGWVDWDGETLSAGRIRGSRDGYSLQEAMLKRKFI